MMPPQGQCSPDNAFIELNHLGTYVKRAVPVRVARVQQLSGVSGSTCFLLRLCCAIPYYLGAGVFS